ncbi:glycosyltransferase [Nodosilinea sp. LEGE 06152]|uniref:glycosyltransferase family 2 protein n=1 Tax=Nodosilinea sp. LEGE 06152 TaxID=2777966 RepID=UPI00188237BB|nr:glycosyltransferase [Nodosilinea sp. LEGE 06152]MBE9159354.1 glycosyltransferase [Nodosilinea sp. LEGE 06152]
MNSSSGNASELSNISVIIPVYNGGESFRRCLDSLRQSSRQPDEVIVVADGDTDGSWEVAKDFGATVFRYDTPGGPARARNQGARLARGSILFFIDADVTVGFDTILNVEKAFQQDVSLAALIGSYDDQPGAENFLSQYKNLFHHYTHQVSSEKASTFWGACGAIRAEAFEAVGGFDERYRKPCVEDIELGYRLKRAGYTIRLCKHIQVKHLKCWQPMSLLRAEIFYRALPWTELILTQGQPMNDLNLDRTNQLSVVLSFVALGCLVLGLVNPFLWIVAIATMVGLLVINQRVYRFFLHKRGVLFALRVIPWHWFYFLYGGAAFAYGTATYRLRQFSTFSN